MAQLKNTSQSFNTLLLTALLFLSGLCGISYEILYARMLNNLIGDTFAVNASILITFLAGIGFGTRFAYKFRSWLWVIEGGIGLYAIAFTLLQPQLDYLVFQFFTVKSLSGNVLISSALLLLPAFLVGISLPLFASYLHKYVRKRVFSLSYMVYNFGAAITAILVEFVLIRQLGLRNAVFALAVVNLGIAGVLYSLNFGGETVRLPRKSVRYSGKIIIALGLFSVASAVFQLWVIKIAQFIYGPYHETFAMVLGIILLGIAIGAFLTKQFHVKFQLFLGVNVLLILIVLAVFPQILALYAAGSDIIAQSFIIPWKILILFVIAGGSAICFGAAIPSIMITEQDVAKESGFLLFISSMANVAGYLLMVFLIHPLLEYGQILFVIAALSSVAFLLVSSTRITRLLLPATTGFAGLVLLFTLWNEDTLYLDYTSFSSLEDYRDELADYDKGQRFRKYDETFAINTFNGNEYFFINGYTSIPMNSPPEYIVGAVSTLMAPRMEQALVLGLGSGATAGTVAELFPRVDVVEINPIIIEKQPLMKQYSFDIMNKSNADIHLDDGIRFLKSTEINYDLIVNTVTTPLYFSSSKLYTRDFFQEVKTNLSPGGIYTTWLDSRVGESGLRIILQTLRSEFRYCWVSMMKAQYFLLHCSNSPIALRQNQAVESQHTLRQFLLSEHGRFVNNIKFAIINTNPFDYLSDSNDVELLNTLNRPVLEFEMARLPDGDLETFQDFILQNYDITKMKSEVYPSLEQFNLADVYTYHMNVSTSSRFTHFIGETAEHRQPDFEETYKDYLLNQYDRVADTSNSVSILMHYADWLDYFGETDQAIALLEQASGIDPEYPMLQYSLGKLYYDQRDFDKARLAFKRNIESSPTHASGLYRLGKACYRLGEYEAALQWFQRCLEENALYNNANRYAGMSAYFLDHGDLAREHLRRELKFDPDDKVAARQLTRLNSK